MSEQTTNEIENIVSIKEKCIKELKKYFEINNLAIKALSPHIVNKVKNISYEELILGEKPCFHNYLIRVSVNAGVWCDFERWNMRENDYETSKEHVYNLVRQPFSGFGWLMKNEEESNIDICNSNRAVVDQYFDNNDRYERYYAYSDKSSLANEIGFKTANDFVFLSTVQNSKRAYLRKASTLVDLKDCILNNEKQPIYIPILPIYIMGFGGQKILVGSYNINKNEVVIDYLKKEISDYEKKIKKQKEKKFRIIKITVTSVVIVLIAFALFMIYK